MTALNFVMPAQAGIQVVLEKPSILQMAKPLNSDLAQRARVFMSD
jgi:hypothetical protein